MRGAGADEIDAIAGKREAAQHDMGRRIVAQMLTCMDDLASEGVPGEGGEEAAPAPHPHGHVFVIGAGAPVQLHSHCARPLAACIRCRRNPVKTVT